jgi:ribonuclease J
MKIKIHKGTEEIGGSCIELSTANTKILLDYGTPLSDDSVKIERPKDIDAILISHPHQDHFGEIVNIESDLPVYCGELSRELMNATKIFTGEDILKNNFHIFKAWESFSIGEFKVTPYLVDHSATDAYAFLIEAEGKRVLYSGDFRANGRKAKLFDKMIEDKRLKDIDVLLMEGTMIRRSNKDFPDEKSVEDKIYETVKKTKTISFMIASSQNIDSIVSAYRACKKAKKVFVIDIYTAWILEKMKLISSSIPNMSWNDVKVIKKFGSGYYQKLKENEIYFKQFKFEVFNHIVEIDEIKSNPQNYFLKISPWHIDKVLNYCNIENSNIIYSQWLGYLQERYSGEKMASLFQDLKQNSNWVYAHTSGHADLPALKKFASAINAKKLIPIHTEYKEEFEEHFENVTVLRDGEVYDVSENNLTQYQVDKLNDIFQEDLNDYEYKYEQAKQIVCNSKNFEIYFLQTKLSVGYNEAATYLQRMIDEGIINEERTKLLIHQD